MEFRKFGPISDSVSILGFGAGHIGRDSISDGEAGKLLNLVLDSGVNLIDTARGYSQSEQRIGNAISSRRDEYILVTKGGYSVEGEDNWTRGAIVRSLEDSLRLMKTDRVDLFLLHSCSMEQLQSEEVLSALEEIVESGKALHVGYSGENEELDWALDCDRFSAVETSVNICDQGNLYGRIERARQSAMGVIAKRPLANAFWRYAERPVGRYADEYWQRWQHMASLGIDDLPDAGDHEDMLECAWGLVAGIADISCAIIGTSSPVNFRTNLKMAGGNKALGASRRKALQRAWEDGSRGAWRGEI
jgi:aryl-alcohol dehydrogenase-like predicted oxidoreductase